MSDLLCGMTEVPSGAPAAAVRRRLMEERKSIFIIEKNTEIRDRLVRILEKQNGFKVCGTSEDLREPVIAIVRLDPDIVIIDNSFSTVEAEEIMKRIKKRSPEIFILALSMRKGFFYADRAIKAGADGYLSVREIQEQLEPALSRILQGEIYLPDNMKSALINTYMQWLEISKDE